MIVEYDQSFLKSVAKLKNATIRKRLLKFIESAEQAHSVSELRGTKKLAGFKDYYRTRLGDYRLGFISTKHDRIRLIIILHRKEIYNYFPPR